MLKNSIISNLCIGTSFALLATSVLAQQSDKKAVQKPNIVFILTDNLGYGELGCYGGGILRGAPTPEIDKLATEGLRLLNYNTEPMCTPSRSCLLTGRFSIRSGTYDLSTKKIYGLVQWENTIAELLSDEGYATALFGKWHLGNTDGRMPVDQGFDEYYGIPNTSDEVLYPDRHEYGINYGYYRCVLEGKKGEKVHIVKTYDDEAKRNIDDELTKRTIDFIKKNQKADKPFYALVSYTQVHYPTKPSRQFEGKTGNGDWADVLSQMDSNIGLLLKTINQLHLDENTIFVFTSDNGAEDIFPWRGWSGPWSGSYFTAMEGGLRTPFIIKWPNKIPNNTISNEIVHEVDIFTTLLKFAGAKIPNDRPIDGIDQSDFFLGKNNHSNRQGFPVYVGSNLEAVKYKNWKIHYAWQEYLTETRKVLSTPVVFNLFTNPKEYIYDIPSYIPNKNELEKEKQKNDSIIVKEASKIINTLQQSIQEYPNIPMFTEDPYVPNYKFK